VILVRSISLLPQLSALFDIFLIILHIKAEISLGKPCDFVRKLMRVYHRRHTGSLKQTLDLVGTQILVDRHDGTDTAGDCEIAYRPEIAVLPGDGNLRPLRQYRAEICRKRLYLVKRTGIGYLPYLIAVGEEECRSFAVKLGGALYKLTERGYVPYVVHKTGIVFHH